MKEFKQFIKEAQDSKRDRVKTAREYTEPIAKGVLEKHGYDITKSTPDEDFKGIDLKVYNKKTKKTTLIDVKCSKPENQGSKNFLYTTMTVDGRSYEDKLTEYVAFLNFPENELVLIEFNEIKKLIKDCRQIPSKHGGQGKYVLIPKNVVREHGHKIIDKELIK